MQGAVAYS